MSRAMQLRFRPQIDGLEEKSLLSIGGLPSINLPPINLPPINLPPINLPNPFNPPSPPPIPTINYSPGPGALRPNYQSLNSHAIRFLYNNPVSRFDVPTANKSANSLSTKPSSYGSRNTSNHYVTLNTNQTVLFFMQDVDTKKWGYVAVKYDGLNFYTLTPNGKTGKLADGSRVSLGMSAGGSQIGIWLANPANDNTWNRNDLQYHFYINNG